MMRTSLSQKEDSVRQEQYQFLTSKSIRTEHTVLMNQAMFLPSKWQVLRKKLTQDKRPMIMKTSLLQKEDSERLEQYQFQTSKSTQTEHTVQMNQAMFWQ